jgi:hypothetical protein
LAVAHLVVEHLMIHLLLATALVVEVLTQQTTHLEVLETANQVL